MNFFGNPFVVAVTSAVVVFIVFTIEVFALAVFAAVVVGVVVRR